MMLRKGSTGRGNKNIPKKTHAINVEIQIEAGRLCFHIINSRKAIAETTTKDRQHRSRPRCCSRNHIPVLGQENRKAKQSGNTSTTVRVWRIGMTITWTRGEKTTWRNSPFVLSILALTHCSFRTGDTYPLRSNGTLIEITSLPKPLLRARRSIQYGGEGILAIHSASQCYLYVSSKWKCCVSISQLIAGLSQSGRTKSLD